MNNDGKKSNCALCIYFSRSPGVKNYFINKCSYWGLKSINIMPQLVVFESIGKVCPFFINKNDKNNLKKTIKSDFNKSENDINIEI